MVRAREAVSLDAVFTSRHLTCEVPRWIDSLYARAADAPSISCGRYDSVGALRNISATP